MEWEKYKQIYTDIWNLHKKYYQEKDWDRFVAEYTEIGARYNHPFCEALLVAVAEDLSNDTGDKGE